MTLKTGQNRPVQLGIRHQFGLVIKKKKEN